MYLKYTQYSINELSTSNFSKYVSEMHLCKFLEVIPYMLLRNIFQKHLKDFTLASTVSN